MTREAVLKRIAGLLPGRSLAALMLHDEWHSSAKLLAARRREAMEGWARTRQQFLEDSESLLEENARANAARKDLAVER